MNSLRFLHFYVSNFQIKTLILISETRDIFIIYYQIQAKALVES